MRVLYFATHSTNTAIYLKQEKSLLIMALTSLEKRARDSTNLKSVPGLTIPRHALMVNQLAKGSNH